MKRKDYLLIAAFLLVLPAGCLSLGRSDTLFLHFDSLPAFSLQFHPWTTADADQKPTYGFLEYDFPHMGEPMAFICFNPDSVTPPLSGDPAIQAHSGKQFAACFSSNPPANNDWIISPRITLGNNPEFSFWVKAYTDEYAPEKYRVAVSVTDSLPGSFTVISGAAPLQPSLQWTRKTFSLSGYSNQSVFVAIQAVSDDAFILMLDDLMIVTEGSPEPVADFRADKTLIMPGGSVRFTDLSSGDPVAWEWSFPGGIPDTSSLRDPSGIVYPMPGSWDVTLKVTNAYGSSDLTREGYITVTSNPSEAALDFESVPDFAISMAPWTTIDAGGGQTYGILSVDYPNKYDPKAFMCFNPSATVPPEPFMKPHTGNKLGCCFSSVPPFNPNDKWLISPKLRLGADAGIAFWAMTYNELYGIEKFNVGVSVSDTNPAHFQLLNAAPEAAPLDWTLFSYDLNDYTGQDIYVGIQCVSNDQFILLIDDVVIRSTVGADEDPAQSFLTCYPNPTDGRLFIMPSGIPEGTLCRAMIYSLAGKLLQETTFTAGQDPYIMDLSERKAGSYILSTEINGRIINRKVTLIR